MTNTYDTLSKKSILAISGIWIFICILLFYFLQRGYAYHFFFIEQSQIFLWTESFFMETVMNIGGLNQWISDFLMQYFIYPYAGPAIISILLTLIGAGISCLLGRIDRNRIFLPLTLLPPFFLLCINFDFNYFLQGTVGFLFFLIALNGYIRIKRSQLRISYGILFGMILYIFFGSIAFLFALCASLCEIMEKKVKFYIALLPFISILFIGILLVYFSAISDYTIAFTPESYYITNLKPAQVIHYSWILMPILILLSYLMNWLIKKKISIKVRVIIYLVQLIMIGFIFSFGIKKYDNRKALELKQLDYYARNEQWDKTIARCQGKMSNFLYKCHLNLALANEGKLADSMFSFDQKGVQSALVQWNKTENISCLLSDIYYAMGDIAPSQEMAFEGYISARETGNPRMLKRLIQTNLIYGEYAVAEKYINILEHTLAYKDWAKTQRKFLYNDDAVLKDKELGSRRLTLPDSSKLSQINGLNGDLEDIISKNPSFTNAYHYLGGFYLLNKDLEGFKYFIEKYYSADSGRPIPKSFQEAVIVMSEGNPDYWKQFHLSQDIINRFGDYKRQVLANRQDAGIANLLYRSYGDTYWFYYMFKQ